MVEIQVRMTDSILECLDLKHGSIPDSNILLMQILGASMTARVIGFLPYTRKTWTEFLALGFGLARPWLSEE